MTTTLEAIYENGKLVLSRPLPLPEKALVQVTVESPRPSESGVMRDELLDVERRNRVWRELDDAEGW
jgi:predicted DNA-binding antitoxin AbrB/MazE fold protein